MGGLVYKRLVWAVAAVEVVEDAAGVAVLVRTVKASICGPGLARDMGCILRGSGHWRGGCIGLGFPGRPHQEERRRMGSLWHLAWPSSLRLRSPK